MFRGIIMTFIVFLLLLCLMGTFYASYTGIGLVNAGAASVREGSSGGPVIRGGGPSGGK
ncbi:MAG: hypothetical protein GYB66_08440 [Chloroflexi bacterium]|jgi:hypothetical protein|nr:hypothetical protein [Chloroflexota bacterium]